MKKIDAKVGVCGFIEFENGTGDYIRKCVDEDLSVTIDKELAMIQFLYKIFSNLYFS